MDGADNNGHQAGQQMLDLFASVGATKFDVTLTTRAGDKEWFRRNVALDELRRQLPSMLDHAPAKERNVIVRPHGPGVIFIQLDDLKDDRLKGLQQAAFLTLETSPGNFQAWVALPPALPDADFARRLRKGANADPTASGATRVAGSLNFKDKYAPAFPRVAIRHAEAGLLTSAAALESLGLVAAPEPAPRHAAPRPRVGTTSNRRWPSYARCVDGAPLNSEETGPDLSRADFVFCMTAITWGWSAHETAERLMEESAKARKNGKTYVELTVRNAGLAVERRRQAPRDPRLS